MTPAEMMCLTMVIVAAVICSAQSHARPCTLVG